MGILKIKLNSSLCELPRSQAIQIWPEDPEESMIRVRLYKNPCSMSILNNIIDDCLFRFFLDYLLFFTVFKEKRDWYKY